MHVVAMPKENIQGRGRDPSFTLPQFFAQVDGMRTAFADTKRGKKTLVFIHGLAGNAAHWVHVAPAFTADYRVIAVDLPGCGESQAYPGHYSVRMYARHVLRLLDTLEIERATLIGHSLGGMVGTEMAFAAAERVERLILLNPAGFQRVPLSLQALGWLAIRPSIMNFLLPKVYKRVLGQVFAHSNRYTEQFTHMVRATYKDEDIDLVSSVIYALRHDFLGMDYTPRLPAIPVPVFFLWGGEDKLVPSERIKQAGMTLKNVHAEEIPGCGHMPNIEQPEKVIHFIEEALAKP
jgi:pimeloyl-ACP methyl ester carboxylesterase